MYLQRVPVELHGYEVLLAVRSTLGTNFQFPGQRAHYLRRIR